MEIHRRSRIEATNIGHIAADVARRNIEGAAQRDEGMCEIATNTVAALDNVIGRKVR